MKRVAACTTAGVALWCSLGTLGLAGTPPASARLALLPHWWLLPIAVAVVFGVDRLAKLTTAQLGVLTGSGLAIVPWLPIPLPAAALIWTGPCVGALWIGVIAGVVAAGDPRLRTQWLAEPRRARLFAGVISLALFAASAWWLSPIPPSGDAPHYLIITQSLLRDGDIRIENNHQRGEYLEYYPGALKPDYLRRGKNGEIYSIHAPGLSVLIAPAFFLFGLPGATAFLALIGSLGAAAAWHLGQRITGSAGAAWFGWACATLTAPLFFVVSEMFPDGIAATLVLFGMFPALDPDIERRSWRVWLIAGIALGILPWLGSRLVAIAVIAGVCLVLRVRRVSQLAAFALPGAISATIWFLFFYVLYGTINPSAPYGSYTQMAAANLVRSVPGLIFDEQFGLISNAPIYGFVLVGIVAAAMRGRRWSIELLAVLVPYMIAVGMWAIWWAGTSSPARYWTPLSLVLGVAAARVWHDVRARGTAVLGGVALGVSVLITVALLIPDRGGLLFNFRDGVALWLEWASDLVDLPRSAPSAFRDTVGQMWMKAIVWTAFLGAAWFVMRTLGKKQRGTLALAAPWTLAIAVMLAVTVSWRVSGAEPLTPQTGSLQLLRGVSPLATNAYDYGSHQIEPVSSALSTLRLTTPERRAPGRPAPLLSIPNVPAGMYRLHLVRTAQSVGPSSDGESDDRGTVTMRAGSGMAFRTWTLSKDGSDSLDPPVHLAAGVRSLVVDGNEAARRTLKAVELQPVIDTSASASSLLVARRAALATRYGDADVYFMDEHAFAEPNGFWLMGGQSARILITGPLPTKLLLRNAPVANVVTIGSQTIELGPGEEKVIELPVSGLVVPLRMRAARGFRPWDSDHANADMRFLGCWVELR